MNILIDYIIATSYQTYVNKLRPGTFDSLNKRYEHPRMIIFSMMLIIMFLQLQGRAFGKEQIQVSNT